MVSLKASFKNIAREKKTMTKTTESSLIQGAHYNNRQRVMTISLKTGNTYQYVGVDKFVWNEFIESPSLGEYFTTNIRPKYFCQKI
jgi:hypothetical protein